MIIIERVCMTITVQFQFMLSYTEAIEKKILNSVGLFCILYLLYNTLLPLRLT